MIFLSKKKLDRNEKYNREILGIALISFGILSAISLFSYKTGIVGILLRNVYFTLMGFGGYIFPVIILALGLLFIINKVNMEDGKKSIYIFILFICFLTLLNIKNQKFTTFAKSINQSLKLSKDGLGGGLIGGFLGYIFFKLFGTIGSYVIISFIIIVSILQFTEIRINDYLKDTY